MGKRRRKVQCPKPKQPAAPPGLALIYQQHPGLLEAEEECRREVAWLRELAFLDLPVMLCEGGDGEGVKCSQFKLSHWRELAALRSPLVLGGPVALEHLTQFLWIISTERAKISASATDEERQAAWLAFASALDLGEEEFATVYDEIRAYKADAFMDAGGSNSDREPSACTSIYVWREVHRLHPSQAEYILSLPFAAIFQFIRLASDAADYSAGKTPPNWGRIDQVRRRIVFGENP